MTAAALVVALATALAPVRVGSKSFAESRILAEIFAQAMEAHGVPVERRLGLGGSEVAFAALESGALDARIGKLKACPTRFEPSVPL